MKKNINLAIIGLGQIGIYLLNEILLKKKDIENNTGKKINIVAISAKNINKKRKYKINKKIFFKDPLDIFKNKNVDIIFEAIGLNEDLVHAHFLGTPSRINGVGIEEIAQESLLRHGNALEETADTNSILPGGGFYNWRRRQDGHSSRATF